MSPPFAPTGITEKIINGITEGFGLLGPDFTILDLNDEAVRIDGRSREALIGLSHWDAYPGSEHSELGLLYKKAMSERVAVSLEHCYQWPDGRTAWLDMRAFPVDGGGLVLLYRDITRRREREDQLRLSEARFKAAIDAVEGVLWTNTPDGRMEGEQPGWSALTGQTYEAYRGYGWALAVHPEDAERSIQVWRKAVASRSTYEIEHRVLRHDGQWRHFSVRAIPVLDAAGSVIEWVGVHRDITDSREAADRLARNADTFQTLVSENPYGVYVVDPEFRLATLSRGARPTFEGIGAPEGRDFAEVIHTFWAGPVATHILNQFCHTLRTGEPFRQERLSIRRVGSSVDEVYDWSLQRITMPDGRFGVVCYFVDLSERERAWRDAAELKALYAQAPLGLLQLDAELRYVRINEAMAAMNGLSVEAHLGKRVWDVVPGMREVLEPMLNEVLRTGRVFRDVSVVGTTPAMPGVLREWSAHYHPLYTEGGAITGIGIVAEEVTDRRRQEKALRNSEDELRRVLDQLFAFVGVLNPEGKVTYANRTPLEAAGMTLDDVVGRPFEDASWWSYDTQVQDQLRAAIRDAAQGTVVRYDVPVKLGSQLVTIDFQLSPLRDYEGVITGLIPSGVVIEERVQAEAALRRLKESLECEVALRTAELRESNSKLTEEIARREAAQEALLQSRKLEAMGRLVAGVSHDFNNVLAAVLSGLAIIERRTDEPRVRDIVAMSTTAARRGAGLIHQLLAFARQQPLAPQAIAMQTVVAELRPILEVSLTATVQLDVELDPQCPAVNVDAAQLQSALLNLAINARDAMPNGGRLRIAAQAIVAPGDRLPLDLQPGAYVAIAVEDNGTGMSAETLARVAEPFFTTKGVGKGTGLGVAMVHGFANQSGGAMTIESTLGVGTTVTLYLPQAKELPASASAERTQVTMASPAVVLVVDDDQVMRQLTALTVSDLGLEVVAAADGESALQLLEQRKVDLVLTDVVMPKMSGVELAQRVRERYSDIGVLFMTAQADETQLVGEQVLRKPFSRDLLAGALASSLSANPNP